MRKVAIGVTVVLGLCWAFLFLFATVAHSYAAPPLKEGIPAAYFRWYFGAPIVAILTCAAQCVWLARTIEPRNAYIGLGALALATLFFSFAWYAYLATAIFFIIIGSA